MFELFKRRLGVKIIVPIALITLAIFICLFIGNRYWQTQNTIRIINDSAHKISDLMLSAIEEPMSIGDDEGTVEQLKKAGKQFPDIKVFLTNFKGNITYSTEQEVVRNDLGSLYENSEFNDLFSRSLEMGVEEGTQLTIQGTPSFIEVSTIKNREACYHCHGSKQPILGSLVMLQDLSKQAAALRETQINTALISLSGAVILILTLMVFIRKSVVSKVRTISAVSDSIRQGDYDAEFDIGGRDELGNLSQNLRQMVATIRDNLEYNKSVLIGIILPLFVTDQDNNINYVNEPLKNILSKDESEILGHAASSLLRDDAGVTDTSEVIRTGSGKSGRIEHKRDDGVVFPLHCEISPLKNAEGQVVGAIGILVDQTQEERDKARIVAQQQNLLQVANKVTDLAGLLSTSAENLNERMGELAKSMDTTSGQTSQVATAMDEMNVSVIEVAKNASSAAEASGDANKVAQQGGDEMRSTVADTRDLAQRAEQLAESLNDLSEKAESIGRILNVINDIADQTNLLALNAAIEAARAGDAGRGFAVVADEVRKLAEKTMEATKEVESAIASIQESTRMAVEEMDDTKTRIEATADKAEESGKLLEEIVEQSSKIADMVQSIATAAEEQSATSEQINTGLSDINELSNTVSDGIQEASEAIRQVSEMAGELAKMVEEFKGDGQDGETEEQSDNNNDSNHNSSPDGKLDSSLNSGNDSSLDNPEPESVGFNHDCYIRVGDESIEVSLVDIDPESCRLSLKHKDDMSVIKEGATVVVDTMIIHEKADLNGLQGQVAWKNGSEFGVKFDQKLDLSTSELQESQTPVLSDM